MKNRNRNRWQLVHDASYVTLKRTPVSTKTYLVDESNFFDFMSSASGKVTRGRHVGFTRKARNKK